LQKSLSEISKSDFFKILFRKENYESALMALGGKK
jgi:hypothetical protein